jgi:hypothetical protein
MSINARAGNDVGVDPHKHTLTATVLDDRGGVLGTASFKVSGSGHRELEAWVSSLGQVRRWGIEGASGLGRHVSAFLALRGHDVRDVNPNRTNDRRRRRQQGKTDNSDSLRIAREVQAEPDLPVAFKRAAGDAGPDETTELIALWHKARKSLLKTRQHVLNESEALLVALPVELREELPDTSQIRPRLAAVARRDRSRRFDAATELRLRLIEDNWTQISDVDAREREATRELTRLCAQVSTLDELVGLSTRSVAQLLAEAGDPRRFTQGGFARFNGTAPLEASSGEGNGAPVRHRLNQGGNRRVNAVLYQMAITQLRCDERARAIYDDARRRGHTKREALRILKRHLSNVVWRHMMQDIQRRLRDRPPALRTTTEEPPQHLLT